VTTHTNCRRTGRVLMRQGHIWCLFPHQFVFVFRFNLVILSPGFWRSDVRDVRSRPMDMSDVPSRDMSDVASRDMSPWSLTPPISKKVRKRVKEQVWPSVWAGVRTLLRAASSVAKGPPLAARASRRTWSKRLSCTAYLMAALLVGTNNLQYLKLCNYNVSSCVVTMFQVAGLHPPQAALFDRQA